MTGYPDLHQQFILHAAPPSPCFTFPLPSFLFLLFFIHMMIRYADVPFQVFLPCHRAAAEGNGERDALNTEFADVFPQLPNQAFCFIRAGSRQEYGEFITACPEDHRFFGKRETQEFRGASDIFISGDMTAGIVHLLQPVAVRDDDTQRIRSKLLQLRQILRIIAAVINPGQLTS